MPISPPGILQPPPGIRLLAPPSPPLAFPSLLEPILQAFPAFASWTPSLLDHPPCIPSPLAWHCTSWHTFTYWTPGAPSSGPPSAAGAPSCWHLLVLAPPAGAPSPAGGAETPLEHLLLLETSPAGGVEHLLLEHLLLLEHPHPAGGVGTS